MDKNMNHDDIKKIVSETISNPDILDFIAKQIQDQIEKEQSKVEQNKISDKKVEAKIDNHTKNKINDIKSKADNYTSNNEYVNKYISERDKHMDVFKKVTDKINQENNKKPVQEEITQEPSKKTWTQKTSSYGYRYNFADGWYKWYEETTDGKVIGDLFFDLIRGNTNNLNAFLSIYSILNLHADEWKNWEVDHYDQRILNLPISKLEDNYTYSFTPDESKKIDNNEDLVYSYTHVEIDNELPMVTIYLIDYSKKTNKVYDFNRIIFTPSEDASEEDIKSFYWHLCHYFRDESNVSNVLDDYCYTFINKYIIHGVSIMPKTEEEYYKMMKLYLMFLLEPKKKENMKVETVEIKATDTTDKTNSVLDKLGFPHDEKGNVEIPISDDNFIANRIKSWFDFDDKMENIPVESNEINKDLNGEKSSDWSLIDTGYENYNAFLANAINDGFIKIEIISDEHIHLNINGTLVFMNNPYTAMDDRDTFGNKL